MLIKVVIFVVSFVAIASARSSSGSSCNMRCSRRGDSSTAGDFEYYNLAMSSAPSFCSSHQKLRSSSECSGDYCLVLHGFWPTNSDGTWPSACGPQMSNDELVQVLNESVPDWQTIAPEYDVCMAAHEWYCHGTCSALSAGDYFKMAFEAARPYIKPSDCNADASYYFDKNGNLMDNRGREF
jgi:ribonuclease I